jgi:hypothetical protein
LAEPRAIRRRTCSECLHYRDPYRERRTVEIGLGECHFNPPKASEELKRARFPLVMPDDWCGQFSRRIDYHE